MGNGVLVWRAATTCRAEAAFSWARVRQTCTRGAVGVPAADHHPRRHLRRRRHGDRRRGAGGRRGAVRRTRHLSRARPGGTCGEAIIEGGVQTGRRDAAGRHQRAARPLPHRSAGAAARSRRRCRTSRTNKWLVLALLNVLFLLLGMFLHSAAAIILVVPVVMPLVQRGRHRPRAFRPDRHHQSRHRPADAAGGERADGRMLDRQGIDLGGDPRQRLVHRRAARRAAAGDLRAGHGRWGWSSCSTDDRRHNDDTIVVARDGAIATVMLNRPDKLNALTKAMWRGLGEAITDLVRR